MEARRVDEVEVLARQQVVLVDPIVGEHEVHRLANDQCVFRIGIEIESVLVSQVGRGLAVTIDDGGATPEHCTMIGRDDRDAIL